MSNECTLIELKPFKSLQFMSNPCTALAYSRLRNAIFFMLQHKALHYGSIDQQGS